jgi:hypothetical protein
MCVRCYLGAHADFCIFWEPSQIIIPFSHSFYCCSQLCICYGILLLLLVAIILFFEKFIICISTWILYMSYLFNILSSIVVNNQQMRRDNSMIYWCIPDFTPTCFTNSLPSSGGSYLPQKLLNQYLCCGCIWITICPVWPAVMRMCLLFSTVF